MTAVRVVLVEDHPEYRETIGLLLAEESDIDLVGQFGTAERALGTLGRMEPHLLPNILLLDLDLPGMNGTEAIGQFLSIAPKTRVIILTQSDREADVLRAITQGASGYLLKASEADQICDGIRKVAEGGAILDSALAGLLLDTLRARVPKDIMEGLLTPREIEVITLIAEGLAKKEIADRLKISSSTVATHVAHIYEKLQVPNAPAAVAKAFHSGILP